MELATISRDEIRVYRGPDWDVPVMKHTSTAINADGMCWSPDGFLLGALNADGGVSVYDARNGYKQVFEGKKQHNSIRHFYFSPKLTYLVTYERYASKDDFDNVFVYNMSTGEIPLKIKLRSVTERNWPIFQWSEEERFCLHMTTNTVKVMHGRNLSLQSPLYSLTIPNIAEYTLSPNGKLLAAFFPEAKGQPASLRIFDISDRSARPRAAKSSFNAQTAKVYWNTSSTALVAVFATESDTTSSSYYGTSSLVFLRVSETGEITTSTTVTGESAGPCHDVCWSNSHDEFVAVTGPMPAEIALYDGRTGLKRISFGSTRRNTLRWSGFGRMFLAGGFGNLPGDIDVWDKNRGLCLSSTRIPCTVLCEWGPDGRHFLSSSIFPRMRVDNFVNIVRYDGTVVAKLTDFKELYSVKWRPCSDPADLFDDTPPSPRVIQNARKPAGEEVAETKPKAAYRPPGGSGALAEQMRKEREIENQKKAVKVKIVDVDSVPGLTIKTGPSAAALRNARKKRAAEAKKNGVFSVAKSDNTTPDNSDSDDESPKAPLIAAPVETTAAKRIRNLNKKLKEIAALRVERDSGKPLSAAQITKIESESKILEEIAQLEKE
jgi:translation initiation factor 2A